mmetsp:Transcript_7649/g.18475  ORF Transcript_7649/g.18475 Transcript_7649/m.18475 type:complete len:138 (-) Transcript_7649:172-585(-)
MHARAFPCLPGLILRFFFRTGVSSGLRRTVPDALERPTTDDPAPLPSAADALPVDRRGAPCLNRAILCNYFAIDRRSGSLCSRCYPLPFWLRFSIGWINDQTPSDARVLVFTQQQPSKLAARSNGVSSCYLRSTTIG